MAKKRTNEEFRKQRILKKISKTWLFTPGHPTEKNCYQKGGAMGSAAGVANREENKIK